MSTTISYVRDDGLPIAIRGGGHSAPAHLQSKMPLVINLSRHLNGAMIDVEKQLARWWRCYLGNC
jgi:FAD/FMN-containing dehydrogenase